MEAIEKVKVRARGAEDVVYPVVYLTHEGPGFGFCRPRFVDGKPIYLCVDSGVEPEIMVKVLKRPFLVKLCHQVSRSGKHSYKSHLLVEGYLYLLEQEYSFPHRGTRLTDDEVEKLKQFNQWKPLVAWAVAEGYNLVWLLNEIGEVEAPKFWGVEEALRALKPVQGRLYAAPVEVEEEENLPLPWRYGFEITICGCRLISGPMGFGVIKVTSRTILIKSDEGFKVVSGEHWVKELPAGCYLFHHFDPPKEV